MISSSMTTTGTDEMPWDERNAAAVSSSHTLRAGATADVPISWRPNSRSTSLRKPSISRHRLLIVFEFKNMGRSSR